MVTDFKVFFYARKNYVNKDGKVAIVIRLALNGQKTQFSSKLTIAPKLWNEKKNRASGKKSKVKVINNQLDEIEATLKFHYREIVRYDLDATVYQVRDAFTGVTIKHRMLLDVFEEYNIELEQREGNDLKKCTIDKYKRTKERLTGFIKNKFQRNDIPVKQVNYGFISSFDNYLTTEWDCGTNTKVKYLQNLKTVINLARNNGWIRNDPFMNFKIKRERSDRGFLTQEELVVLMQKELKVKRLEYVRDIFIFCCFTGLSYIDVKKLEYKHIQHSLDKNQWIRKKREKTGVQANILLLDIPKMILKKYQGMFPDDLALPVISNQRLNGYLKEIADISGIDKNLTFHLARHTFAITVILTNGVPIETVSKMLGAYFYQFHPDLFTEYGYVDFGGYEMPSGVLWN